MSRSAQPIYRVIGETDVSFETFYMTHFSDDTSRHEQAEHIMSRIGQELIEMSLVRDKSEVRMAQDWMRFQDPATQPIVGREPFVAHRPTNIVMK